MFPNASAAGARTSQLDAGARQSETTITEQETGTKVLVVLYEGPLVHDQDWMIKAGPRGPR
jgi:hypothetical protein